jgi:hypothetical protein
MTLVRRPSPFTGLEADRAEATFEHGVLMLRIPRAEQTKARKIQIRPATPATTRPVDVAAPAAKG